MKITKREHSCLDIEIAEKRLIIDPGYFTKTLTDMKNIAAIVVTHAHPDHLNEKLIKAIKSSNPEAVIISTGEVAAELSEIDIVIVEAGSNHSAGPFNLRFFGGQHAAIHESYPVAQNVGVLVNDALYYGGDSYSKPDKPVKALAVPAHAPWMKAAESMDYLRELSPRLAFPTHYGFLSDDGRDLMDRLLSSVVDPAITEYIHLKPGDSREIS